MLPEHVQCLSLSHNDLQVQSLAGVVDRSESFFGEDHGCRDRLREILGGVSFPTKQRHRYFGYSKVFLCTDAATQAEVYLRA